MKRKPPINEWHIAIAEPPLTETPPPDDCQKCFGSGRQSVLIDGYWTAKPCECRQPNLPLSE